MNIEQQVKLLEDYKLTPEELTIAVFIHKVQVEKDATANDFIKANRNIPPYLWSRGNFESLIEKGVIDPSYKIPENMDDFNVFDVKFTETFSLEVL